MQLSSLACVVGRDLMEDFDLAISTTKAEKFMIELGRLVNSIVYAMSVDPECRVDVDLQILTSAQDVEFEKIVYNNLR
jgi:hypothetical protein|tara:strand:+ start:351 stop:584 length:234 start_codon:yes stop_codon:yes gene_type:complete